jgi:hypothetical protein
MTEVPQLGISFGFLGLFIVMADEFHDVVSKAERTHIHTYTYTHVQQ